MKKRYLRPIISRMATLLFVLVAALLTLSACAGNNGSGHTGLETNVPADDEAKPETGDEQKDKESDVVSGDIFGDSGNKDYATLLEEGFGIGFIPHGCDAEHFVPATEDYIIVVEKTEVRENSYPAIFQTGALYSFDEAGNLVQWVSRDRPSHEYEEMTESDKSFLDSDYTDYPQENIDTYNDSAFGGKFDVITDLFVRKENNPELAFYMSKPLTTAQTITSLGADPAEMGFSGFKELVMQTRVGEDYYVSREEGNNTESIRNVEIGHTDHENIYQEVRAYHDHHYYKYFVSSFDERGNVSEMVAFYVFDEESMVEDYLKSQYGAYYDKTEPVSGIVDATLPPDFKLEDTGWSRHDNILYKELTSGSDEKVKWERNAHSEGNNLTYFSMEYLTDSQIEALGVKHGVNK